MQMTVETMPHSQEASEFTEPSVSNLPPDLQEFVRSEGFKDWFGDWENNPEDASKIVDENGEPRLVYAGLPAGIVHIAGDQRLHTGSDEIGFYFTGRYNNARSIAEQRRHRDTDLPVSSSVYGAFLNARNPYYIQPGDGVRSDRVTQVVSNYDAYVNGRLQELVVFDSSQIALITECPVGN